MSKNTKFGTLYIVATPIGNLSDITARALEVLSSVDFCAAENTRKSKVLFNNYQIKTKLFSYHKYSEDKKLDLLIKNLKQGKNIALISDAGTPLISDPGYLLVKEARKEFIDVIPIPGPSSITSVISVSGFPLDSFTFYGFLPRQIKHRKQTIKKISTDTKTSIVFESGKRLKSFLIDLKEESPEIEIFIGREMTKLNETFYRGKVYKVLEKITIERYALKGEFVIVIKGNPPLSRERPINLEQKRILSILLESLEKKQALKLASKIFGISKNYIYKHLLKEK